MVATTGHARFHPRRLAGRALVYVLVAIGGVVFAIPFLWMVRTVFMPASQIWTIPPEWIPERIYLGAFDRLFNLNWKNASGVADTVAEEFRVYMWNSFTYSTLSAIGAMISSAFVGFGFARLRFPGRDKMFVLLLATMILPTHVRIVPTYYLFAKMHWVGTYKPLVIPAYFGPAFFVFLVRQFFMTIPREMDDAAVIDGCNPLNLFLRVHLPLCLPAIGIVGIFQYNGAWNDFFGPLLYVRTKPMAPIAVGLQLLNDTLTYGGDFQTLMAMSLLSIIPPIALFFVAQRRFIEGIVITGVKG
jgi:ABC-type glycerol-3-phosphate transport system permease component